MSRSSTGMERRGQPSRGPQPSVYGKVTHGPPQKRTSWWLDSKTPPEGHSWGRFGQMAGNPAYAPATFEQERRWKKPTGDPVPPPPTESRRPL